MVFGYVFALMLLDRRSKYFSSGDIFCMCAFFKLIKPKSCCCVFSILIQVHHAAKSSPLDSALVQLELSLVDIFLGLCRFEWQAGYQELATALFQAEIEFSLFCPSLLLTEQSKQRLFEHFWNSDGSRVGEEGAFGWSTWLEKEEEYRQRVIKEEESMDGDKGGWTGWSEPLAKKTISDGNLDDEANNDMEGEELQPELEDEDMEGEEDDTEALLKKLGIDVDAASSGEIKDTSTWIRWSKEELSRDGDQWMPLRAKSRGSLSHPPTPPTLYAFLMFPTCFVLSFSDCSPLSILDASPWYMP